MPTTICFARHGQDEDNAAGILNGHRDKPLTSLGINQAKALGNEIFHRKIKIDTILCSPLKRTHDTATIIAEILNLPKPTEFPLIIERNFGVMTGKPLKDIEKFPHENTIKSHFGVTYMLEIEGGESFPTLLARAKLALEEILSTYPSETVLLVGHGDFGKMLYASYFKLEWQFVLQNFHFGNGELVEFSANVTPQTAKVISAEQFNS